MRGYLERIPELGKVRRGDAVAVLAFWRQWMPKQTERSAKYCTAWLTHGGQVAVIEPGLLDERPGEDTPDPQPGEC